MKYAIIEDEQIAMQNLDQMIRQLRPHYQKIFKLILLKKPSSF